MKIIINKKIKNFLQKRDLQKQFKKCCQDLENNNLKKVNLKKLSPKWMNIFSFRINKQFRAMGIFHENVFRIFKISDHQN